MLAKCKHSRADGGVPVAFGREAKNGCCFPENRGNSAATPRQAPRSTELIERSPETNVSHVDLAARIMVNTLELLVHKLITRSICPRFKDELAAMLTQYATAGSERSSGLCAAPSADPVRPLVKWRTSRWTS